MPTLVRDYDTLLLYNNFGGCSNVCFDDNLGYFSLDNNVTIDCLNVTCNTIVTNDLTIDNNLLVCQNLTVNGNACFVNDLDLNGKKVLFANVYSQECDLPDANTYHGMFAHVHSTGKGYFAHAGSWHKIIDQDSSTTTDLTEGTNLYYTNARSRLALCGTGDITYCNTTGEINVTTYKSSDFDTDFSNKSTTDLTEGTNLYYTDARSRSALCGTGYITYCDTTGEINVTTYKSTDFDTDFSGKFTCDLAECGNLYYTDARSRLALCGGTGVTYCDTTGEISIGQDVNTTSNVTFNDVTVCGSLLSDDITASNVFICGDLTVTGTTTTVCSNVVAINDINLTLACNATTPLLADGGGITLNGANACLFYSSTTDTWNLNKNLTANIIGQVSDISNHYTCDLAECINLYYTDARSRLALCGTGDITYCDTTGEISVTTYKSSDFDTDFSNKSTTDLAEGTNLYYTDARVRLALCGTGDITYCNTTGEISVTTYKSSDFDTDFSGKFTCDLAECGNLYYTDARSRLALCGTGDITYCDTTGEINVTTYKSTDFDTDFSGKFTCDLAECGNLYYTDARVDTRFNNSSIGSLCDVSLIGISDGRVLAYNQISGQFEPVDPATGGGGGTTICDIVFSLCETNYIVPENFVATGTTSCFTLSYDYHQYSSLVYLNSIWQRPGCDYTLSNCILNFATTPDSGDIVYARAFSRFDVPDGTITLNKLAQGTFVVECLTGNGSTCTFALSQDPGDVTHMQVAVGGLMQRPGSSYNLTYSAGNPYITFTSPPDNTVDIEVYLNRLVTPIFGITNDNLNLTYTSDQYTGNGGDVCYTIPDGHNNNSVLVFLNGLLMPPTEYCVTGTTLQFNTAPLSCQEIDIRYMPV